MSARKTPALLSPLTSFFARQLALPRGWFGRVVVTRVLNRRNRGLIEAALDGLDLSSDTRLLDVGFGGGLSLELARRRGVTQLWGVEPSAAAVRELSRTHRAWSRGASLTLSEGSVEALPLGDGTVDAIVSTNTVYFWPDLDVAFRELRRVLVPGGRLALGFATAERLREMDAVTRHGFLFYESAELVAAAGRAGFATPRTIEPPGRDTRGTSVLIAER